MAEVYLWCLMDMQGDECSGVVAHALATFPNTYAEGAGSSESNPAPPRLDPLRVWARIAPSFGDYGDYKHLSALGEYPQFRISIHQCYKQYRGGPNGARGGGIPGVAGRGYAGSWI